MAAKHSIVKVQQGPPLMAGKGFKKKVAPKKAAPKSPGGSPGRRPS